MAKADFTAIRPSAKVAGTTRLSRTDSQITTASSASDNSTTASHSAGADTARAATRLMTMKPTKVAARASSRRRSDWPPAPSFVLAGAHVAELAVFRPNDRPGDGGADHGAEQQAQRHDPATMTP